MNPTGMRRRRGALPAVLVSIALLVCFYAILFRRAPARSPERISALPPAPAPAAAGEPAWSPLADELHAPRFDAAHDLAVLRGLIAQFTTTLRLAERPPLGDNADIAAALAGGNRRHVVFIPASHPALRGGVLVDRQGTPYHFHARSADAIDVRSAGPDRLLFTADDLVSPVPAANP